jgi:CARDB
MNFVKRFVVFCMLLMVHYYASAQDLIVDTITVTYRNSSIVATLIIKNRNAAAINSNARIYVALHTNTAATNPIAQIELQANPFMANATQTFNINFNSFVMLKGFTLNQATQLVVTCDPKNEIREQSENNNTKFLALSNLRKPKKET